MDMDFSMPAVIQDGWGIIAIIVLLAGGFIILYWYRKKNYRTSQLRKVAKAAKARDIHLQERYIVNGQFIGIDTSKKILVLAHLHSDQEPVKMIALSNIIFCSVVKRFEEVVHRGRNKTTDEKELVSISLMLYAAAKYPEAEFVFYDNELNKIGEMPELMKEAERWKYLIAMTGNIEIV